MGWYARRDLYESIASSLATSGITSESYNVEGFYDPFTLQIVGSTSTTTVQGSNDNGRTAAITNWSTLTTVINGGMVAVDPGFAWLRCQRSDGTSTSNVILAGWQRSF